jgi:hypothetical protein
MMTAMILGALDVREDLRNAGASHPDGKKNLDREEFDSTGLSQLDFGVDRFEFAAGVVDLNLPVDAALDAVEVGEPSRDLRSQGRDIAEAAVGDALGCQAAQLVLGDVEPTAVLLPAL